MVYEANDRFKSAFYISNDSCSQFIAAYGVANCSLAMADSCFGDGKFGAALEHLKRGISFLENTLISRKSDALASPTQCALKLLGDLHSYASVLPSSVFSVLNEDETVFASDEEKLRFVAAGELAYTSVLGMAEDARASVEHLNQYLNDFISAAYCDLGTNVLFQARILCDIAHEGSGAGTCTSMIDMPAKNKIINETLERSLKLFCKALDSSEQMSTHAWNGIGCVFCAKDPILAQHSFSRALQIDKYCSDAWANLGLLYGEYSNLTASEETIDALTQVTDTPLIWIGRGKLFEEKAFAEADIRKREELRSHAADAYRASLQVAGCPYSLLGLALNSRRRPYQGDAGANDTSKNESLANLTMFLQSGGQNNIGASILGAVMTAENAEHLLQNNFLELGKELILQGCLKMRDGNDCLRRLTTVQSLSHEVVATSGRPTTTVSVKSSSASNSISTIQSSSESCADSLSRWLLEEGRPSSCCDNVIEVSSLSATQRLVHMHPESGENWLEFAKKLIQEITAAEDPSKYYLSIAKAATSRARQILFDNVADKGGIRERTPWQSSLLRNKYSPERTKPSTLAEALALSAWLERLDVFSEGRDKCISIVSRVDVQRALLLDPENRLARAHLSL